MLLDGVLFLVVGMWYMVCLNLKLVYMIMIIVFFVGGNKNIL